MAQAPIRGATTPELMAEVVEAGSYGRGDLRLVEVDSLARYPGSRVGAIDGILPAGEIVKRRGGGPLAAGPAPP